MKTKEEKYHEIKVRAWKDIGDCTCQFLVEEKGQFEGYGSGVFVKIDGHHFLFSAAHVLEEQPHSLIVPSGIGAGGTILQGGININKISGKRKDDRVDIGVFKLTDETIASLNGFYDFLDADVLGINHDLELKEQYLTFGYPVSQTEPKYKTRKVVTKPFGFSTWPKAPDIYVTMNCKQGENIIVHFDKHGFIHTATQEKLIAPDAYGMSGSGLWCVPEQSNDPGQKIKKKLVGILTEWWDEDKKIIISTRIDVATEVIRQAYGLNLPVSNYYQTNINVEKI
jgi:hypothetical protein